MDRKSLKDSLVGGSNRSAYPIIRGGIPMSFVFQIEETGQQPMLCIRKTVAVTKLPQILGEVYGKVVDHIARQGVQPLGPAIIGYFNMDMENLELEIGFPVQEPLAGNDEIVLTYIPAGKKATGFHKGPYQDLAKTYDAMSRWMAEKGYEASGVVYEFYFNSPGEVPETELLTKINFPLK